MYNEQIAEQVKEETGASTFEQALDKAESIFAAYERQLKISNEYANVLAKFTAIKFIEWSAGEGWGPYDSNETWIRHEDKKVVTTVDLYDMFEHRNDWKTRGQKS